MSLSRRFGLAGLLSVVLAGAANAATIFTPPVIPDDDGSSFCLVRNVSAQTRAVMIGVLDVKGGTGGHAGFTVPPLETRAAPGHGASGDRVCRITVNGSKNTIRASVEVLSSG